MTKGTEVILWSLFILVLFVLLTLFEVWFLKRMGFDVLAHLQLTLKQGETRKFFFEAFGVVAFVLIQPFALTYLFSILSDQVQENLRQTLERAAAAIATAIF
jgi:hypothetical protein